MLVEPAAAGRAGGLEPWTNATSPAAILVVDDDPAKRLSIRAVLEPLGLTIIEVDSGVAALHELMERQFAVILLDVQMPNMNGYETARLIRMRRESEQTPIIFITALDLEEAQVPVAYQSGAVDFMLGTIVPDTLRAKVSVFAALHLKASELEKALHDVTALSERSRDSEAYTRAVLDNVADGIITVTGDGLIESYNRSAVDLFGYREHEAIGQPISTMVESSHAGEPSAGENPSGRLLTEIRRGGRAAAAVGRRKDGSTFPLEIDLNDVQLGDRTIHIGCLRDTSERQEYTDMLQYHTFHDDLTGLPNRALFGNRVNHAILAAFRADEPLALLVLDLDDFKAVNDTHGHQHGDALLQLFAERIAGCIREMDTVARLGGDEFGILLAGGDLAGAASVAWKIQQALEPGFLVKGLQTSARASIGIALSPEHGDNIDDLLRRADLAMYEAKQSGEEYALFALEQEEAPARRLTLLGDLRHCVERDELELHYQPKVDLTTRETLGVEALIRWNHPSRGLLMPGAFMAEVERSELLIPITEWVVEEALRQLQAWRADGYDLSMAINLGAQCLAEGALLFETVDDLTRKREIPAERVTFELTESALIDTAVPGLMERLRSMDERLSIDDFGTGYSSLRYLQELPVVEIKADRSFVTTMSSVKEDAVIVRSIIDLAHNLSVKVVAEGVEDEETMNLLVDYGCDEAQGFLFSRAIPAGELSTWLEASPFGLQRHLTEAGVQVGAG